MVQMEWDSFIRTHNKGAVGGSRAMATAHGSCSAASSAATAQTIREKLDQGVCERGGSAVCRPRHGPCRALARPQRACAPASPHDDRGEPSRAHIRTVSSGTAVSEDRERHHGHRRRHWVQPMTIQFATICSSVHVSTRPYGHRKFLDPLLDTKGSDRCDLLGNPGVSDPPIQKSTPQCKQGVKPDGSAFKQQGQRMILQ